MSDLQSCGLMQRANERPFTELDLELVVLTGLGLRERGLGGVRQDLFVDYFAF
jgi:hypothetical protein